MIDSNGNFKIMELIRTDVNCGLCSYIWTTINAAFHAMSNGYVPVIDFRSMFYPQFHDSETHGRINFWEDYFEQPFGISPCGEDCSNWIKNRYNTIFELDSSSVFNKRVMSSLVLRPSRELSKLVDDKMSKINVENTVGVLLRGTDYRTMKPKSHPVQPEIEDVVKDIRNMSDNNGIENVFVVTDERRYAERIGEETGLNVEYAQSVNVKNDRPVYNSNVMRDMDYSTKKSLNMDYISNVIVLSKLRYNLLSRTSALNAYQYFRVCGSKATCEKIYDLGVY